MNDTEIKIAYRLKNYHLGKANSITYKNLARQLDINERELRFIVSELVTHRQFPIATESQSGYYWIETEEEFNHAHGELISRIKKLARRAKGLRLGYMKSKQYEKPKQLQLI